MILFIVVPFLHYPLGFLFCILFFLINESCFCYLFVLRFDIYLLSSAWGEQAFLIRFFDDIIIIIILI